MRWFHQSASEPELTRSANTVIPPTFEVQPLEARLYLTSETHKRRAAVLANDAPTAYVLSPAAAARHAAQNIHARKAAKATPKHKLAHPHKKPARHAAASGGSGIKVVKKHHPKRKTGAAHPASAAATQSNIPATPISSVVDTLNPRVADAVYSMAVQHDGKIVVLGEHNGTFSVLRYLVDGTLDPSFGANGQATVNFDSGKDASHALAIDYAGTSANPDYGKIVVAGESTSGFVIARLKSDGTLDQTFGSGGKVLSVLAGRADSLVLQPSGRILVGGEDASGQPVVIRLVANGQQDMTLGTSGVFHGPILDLTGVASPTGSVTTTIHRKGQIILHPFSCGSGCCSSYSAPSVAFISNPYSVAEGTTFTGSGCVSDPNPGATFSAWVTYGDGSGCQSLTINSGGGFTLSHAYYSDQGYTITVGVTDTNDNEFGSNSTSIDSEPAPSASFSGATIAESQTYTSSGSISSSDSSPSYSATVNYGDGSGTSALTLSGNNFTLNHTYHEFGSFNVTVTPTNTDAGLSAISSPTTQTVTVTQADPQLTIAGAYHAQVGSSYTLSLSEFDSSDALGTGGWNINWGDGSAIQNVSTSTTSVTHTFQDAAASDVITATETDEGTTYTSNRLPIAIQYGTLSDPPVTNVNFMFEPWSRVYTGYNEDFGLTFGDHSDIYGTTTQYDSGWMKDAQATAVSRNAGDAPGYDTFIPLPAQGINGQIQNKWSVGLANGTYQVTILSGDPNVISGARYETYANGTQVVPATYAAGGSGRWVTGTATVTVSNGWLSVYSGPNAVSNVINTISIVPTAHIGSAPSSAPTSLTVYAESTSAVNLNWVDNSDNESTFKIERSITSGSGYSVVGTTVSNATYYTDTGLSAGTTYYYRVVPSNSIGDSSSYASGSAVTLNSNSEAPYKGTAWSIAATGTSTIQAEDFDTGGQNVGYHASLTSNWGGRYRSTGAGINTGGPVEQGYYLGWNVGGNWYNYTINVSVAGTYRLDARVAAELSGGNFVVQLDGTSLTGTLTIPNTGGWNNFQTVSGDSVYLPVGVHKLTLKDTSTGNQAEGNFDWIALTPEATVPAPPLNLAASPVSDSTVQLNWSDDTGLATGYKVLRAAPGGTFSQVGSTLGSTATSYLDTSASASTTYLYEIQAVNAQTAPTPPLTSNQATVRTPASTAAAISATADAYVSSSHSSTNYGNPAFLQTSSSDQRMFLTFDLTQFGSSVNAAKLRLFGSVPSNQTGVTVDVYGLSSPPPTWTEGSLTWSNQPAYTSTPLATESISTGGTRWYEWDISSYVNTQLAAGHKLIGVMLQADVAASSPLSFNSRSSATNAPALLVSTTGAVLPAAPTNLVATTDSASPTSQIDLTWTDNPPTATNIYVQDSTDGTTWSAVTTLSGTSQSYNVTGLSTHQLYYFRVYAKVGSIASGYSNVASATTTASSASISGAVFDLQPSVAQPAPNSGNINLNNVFPSLPDGSLQVPNLAGVNYYPPDNSYLVADLNGLEEVLRDGTRRSFYPSAAGGLNPETSFVVVQTGNTGGFVTGDAFYAVGGGIVRIYNGGTSTQTIFTTPSNLGSIAALTFDTTGIFGNDLVAVTGTGSIWLIDHLGNAAQLALDLGSLSGNDNYEDVAVLPNNQSLYGDFAGRILIGQGTFYGVGRDGSIIHAPAPFNAPPDWENMQVVPPNENFFGVNSAWIVGANASDFSNYVGHLVGMTENYHGMFELGYSSSTGWTLNPINATGFTGPGWEEAGFGGAGIGSGVTTTDAPLAGATVYLDTNNNGVWDSGEPTYTTSSSGAYTFTVTSGTYHVRENPPSGYNRSTPFGAVQTVTVGTDQTVTAIDFGNVPNTPLAPVDTPPLITSSPSSAVTGVNVGDSPTTYTISASDADGDPLTYNLPVHPNWVTLRHSGATYFITVTPPPAFPNPPQSGAVVLTVSDGRGGVAVQPFTVDLGGTTQAPGAPAITTSAPAANQIQVNWSTPSGSPTSYVVWWALASASPSYSDLNHYATTSSTSYTITGLAAGQTYVVAVVAVKGGLDSDFSNLVAQSTWSSTSAAIVVQNAGFYATEGTNFTGTIASFHDQSNSFAYTAYNATINWGDGSSPVSALTGAGSGSWYTVLAPSGGHTYAEEGNYTITVTVTYPGTGSYSTTVPGEAVVSDAPLSVTAQDLSSVGFQQYTPVSTSQPLATFTDADPNATLSDFTAMVEWGDGVYSAGTISQSGSTYTVKGAHTYVISGAQNIKVWVKDEKSAAVSTPQMPITIAAGTSSGPGTPSDFAAYAPSQSVIELTWTNVPGAAGYVIRRYASPTDTNPVIYYPQKPDNTGDIPEVSNGPFDDQNLSPNTTYYYTIQDAWGTSQNPQYSAESSKISTTTLGPPPAPTGLSSTPQSGTSIELNWTPTTNPSNSARIVGWEIYRSTTSGSGYTDLGPYSEPFVDVNLSQNTTYYYQVTAIDFLGEQSSAATTSAATLASLAASGPPAPANLNAGFVGSYGSGTDDRVDLTWQEPSINSALTFNIYRSTDTGFTTETLVGSSSNPWFVDDFNPASYGGATTYYYKIQAIDQDSLGNQSASAPATTTLNVGSGPSAPVAPPSAPTLTLDTTKANGAGGLTATPSHTGAVLLSWQEPTNNNEAEFDIYRAPIVGGTPIFTDIGQVPTETTTFTDATAVPGTSYQYKIAALNLNSGSPQFSALTAITTPAPTLPGPQALTAAGGYSATGNWTVSLSWSDIRTTSGSSPAVSRYLVYRRAALGDFVLVDSVSTPYFSDDKAPGGLDPNAAYYYEVRTVDASGNLSAPSNLATVVISNAGTTEQKPVLQITSPKANPSTAWTIGLTTPINAIIETQSSDTTLTWSATLRPASASSTSQDILVASGTSNVGSIADGGKMLLGLDPTRFPDGGYNLIITASDGAGSATTLTQPVKLQSSLKLGNLALPATDLTLQMPSAAPFTIQRSYDSQQTNLNSPDFGYGWRFNSWDVNLTSTATGAGLKFGDIVYITLPGGEQHSFSFEPYVASTGRRSVTGQTYLVTDYYPQFVATDGSGATLTIPLDIENDGANNGSRITLQQASDGTYVDVTTLATYSLSNSYFNYFTSSSSSFGIKLTTRDNRVYQIDPAAGVLISYTDLQGNIFTYPAASTRTSTGTNYITYTPNGGSASNLISITRSAVNGQDLITQIADARSGGVQSLSYSYDANGNLEVAVDAIGNATTYAVGGELVAPNVTSTSGRTVYAILTSVIAGTTNYWNTSTNAFEAYNAAHWGNYALTMSDAGTNAAWFSVAMPSGIASVSGLKTVNAAYYKTAVSGSPATGDTNVESQSNLLPAGAQPSSSHTGSSYITTILNGIDVPAIQMTYDSSSRMLTSEGDGLGDKSTITTSNFDGYSVIQDKTDLIPPSGATASTADTQTILDRQGNAVRTIRTIKDPSSGSITGYLVTVHEFPLAAGNVADDTSASSQDASNGNAVISETDWQPFTISGSDASGLRYTQTPQTLSLPTGFSTWPHTVISQGLMSDPLSTTANPSKFRVTGSSKYLGDGLVLTTNVGYSVQSGTNDVIKTTIDPYGNVTTETYDPTMTYLLTSQNAVGETTTNTYTSSSPVNGLASTYTSLGTLTYNYYYAGTESGSGPSSNLSIINASGTTVNGVLANALRSHWEYSGVAAPKVTFYAYNADGTVLATYHEFQDNSLDQWVVTLNHYDADGRVIETDTGTYTNSGTTVNTTAHLVGPLTQTFVVYNAAGQKTETYTQYSQLVSGTLTVEPSSGAKFDDTFYYYDAAGNTVRATNENGTEVRSVYDAMGRAIWQTSTFTTGTSTSNATNTVYDSVGHAAITNQYENVGVTVTQDAGNASFYDVSFTAPGSTYKLSTTSTTYDTAGRPATVVGADGRDTVYAYNADGGTTTTTASGVTGQQASTTSAADVYQIATFTGGGTIASGNTFTIQLVSGTTNQSITVTASGSSAATLNAAIATAWTASTQSLFTGFTASYDADSNTVHVKANTADAAWVTINVSKSSSSSTFASRLIHSAEQTDGNGNLTITESDPLNRTYRTDYPDGSFTEDLYSVNSTAVPGYSDQSIVGSEHVSFDQLGNATDSFYDRAKNLTDVYQPTVGGSKPHWNYTYDIDGNEIEQVDPKGNPTQWTYDSMGRQLTHTLPLGIGTTGVPNGLQTETWTYNYLGLKDTYADFLGNFYFYKYASSGYAIGQIYETDIYAYNNGAYPTIGLYYYYDGLARLHQFEEYPATGAIINTYYNYDESGGAVTINSSTGAMTAVTGDLAGNLTSEQVVSGSTTTTVNYVYDAVTGRPVETWTGTSHGSAMTDTRYGYDAQGRLASATILKQQGATPSLTISAIPFYDAVGDSITPSSNYPTTLYSYDADGNTTKVAFPNGTETDTDYSSYWATGTGGVFGTETITNKRGTLTLSSFAYSFDADRRKISDTETMIDVGESTSNTQKYTWTYDALSRLTSESFDYNNDDVSGSMTGRTTDDYTETYTFDLDGNRLTKTLDISSDAGISGHTAEQVIEYTYNADNQLTLEETDNYDGTVGSPVTTTTALQYKNATAYDANGSPLSLTHTDSGGTTTTTYTYDVLNRMSTYAVGGVTTTYRYEGNGNIFSQTVGAGTPTVYLWDTSNPTGYGQVLEVWQGGSTPVQTYTIAKSVLGQNISGTTSFFLPDGMKTTRQVTAYTPSVGTTNGHVTGRYDYDGFGVAVTFRNTTHAHGTASAIGYKGEYVDPITLMLIMGGRQYTPSTGRFWTRDTYPFRPGDLSNPNLYLYVAGNPMNAFDPTGQYTIAEAIDKFGFDPSQPVGSYGRGPTGNDPNGREAFDLTQLAANENTAGYLAASGYASSHLGRIGAYFNASFELGNFMGDQLALDQQALFAIAGTVGATIGSAVASKLIELVDTGIASLLYADTASGGLSGVFSKIGSVFSDISAEVVTAVDTAAEGLCGSKETCFLAGTPVLMGDGKKQAIETIRVAQRVTTDGGIANSADGKTEATNPNATEVNQTTWRELIVNSGDWQIQVLEPVSWIKVHHVKDGSAEPLTNFVDLAEMGVPEGLIGTVESILPCPTIQTGPGRVVLATVSHLNDDLYHLTLKGASGQIETLGVTGYHRFYDESIGWIQVQNMHLGETLRGDHGNLTVVGLVQDPGVFRVYNMTVEADHVYFVGNLTALVHNTCYVANVTPGQPGATSRGPAISYDDALQIVMDGEDVFAGSKSEAAKLARDAGGGIDGILEFEYEMWHYHTWDRNGAHIWF